MSTFICGYVSYIVSSHVDVPALEIQNFYLDMSALDMSSFIYGYVSSGNVISYMDMSVLWICQFSYVDI